MFQILARAKELERQGKNILHFEIGDPDFDTPLNIRRAAVRALESGFTHYEDSRGLLDLREAAIEATERSRGFRLSLDQVLVTPGANSQIFYALACIINPGDEVIIPDPGFVSFASIIRFLGGVPVSVKLREENGFRINPDDIHITQKTRAIIVNSPSNPTGAVMSVSELLSIANIAHRHGIYLLSDEIYARMVYGDFASPSVYDHCKHQTVLINGFSKSYAMTGWRLGVVAGPAPLIKKMGLLLETTSSCVSPFVQKAGVEALKGDQREIEAMVEEYRQRRDILVSGLNRIPGIKCIMPQGSYYAWVNIRETDYSSEEYSNILMDKGLATSPGTIFGKNGEGYVRLCYANTMENIMRALEIMDETA